MKFDIITIGTATQDVFMPSSTFKIIDDSKCLKNIGFITGKAHCLPLGSKIQIKEPVFATGGGATNAAVTFSRQGFKTAALFKMGNDITGEEVVKKLKKEKVFPLAIRDKKLKTDYSVIFLSPDGERTILNYRGASVNLKTEEIPLQSLKNSWAYVSPGKISFSIIEKLFSYFAKNKIFIAFNPSKYYLDMGMKKLKPLLNKTKIVLLNREEASHLTKIPYGKEKKIFKRLDEAVKGIAVMTEGPKGVVISDGKTIYRAGIFPSGGRSASGGKNKKVVDRTGAGDAFGSGFTAGLMKEGYFNEKSIKYAIRLGLANATSVIEYVGAKRGILSKSEFEKSSRWKKIAIKTAKLN